MKFLLANSIVLGLIIAGAASLACAETIGAKVHILGRQYIQVSTLSGSRVYELNEDGINIQVKQIRSISTEVAMTFIGDRLALFRSVFETKRVDYPGQHSRVIECPSEYKPQFSEISGEEYYLAYFVGFANQNKVAGACLPDLITYRYMYGFAYCKKRRQLFEIDHFSDLKVNAVPKFIETLSCDN